MAGERVSSRGGGELPAKTIMRGSVRFVYSNCSLLVLLIFLTFPLSSSFCKVSYLVDHSFLHPLICFSLFWVAYERSNDFVKKRVLTRLRCERKGRAGQSGGRDWGAASGNTHSEEEGVRCCVRLSQLPAARDR